MGICHILSYAVEMTPDGHRKGEAQVLRTLCSLFPWGSLSRRLTSRLEAPHQGLGQLRCAYYELMHQATADSEAEVVLGAGGLSPGPRLQHRPRTLARGYWRRARRRW